MHRKKALSERKLLDGHLTDAPTAAEIEERRAKGKAIQDELNVLGIGEGDSVAFYW